MQVRSLEERATGTVQVDGPDGTSTTRKLEGRDCDEVVAALAVVTALAIDPYGDAAKESPPKPQPSASAPPAAPPAVTPIGTETPPQEQDLRLPLAASAPAIIDDDWLTGAGYAAMSAIGPGMSSGGSVFVGYEPVKGPTLAPRLRITFSFLPPASKVVEQQEGRISWLGARLQSCPVATYGRGLAVMPCVSLGLGSAAAEGMMPGGKRSSMGWADVGASLQGQLDLVSWLVIDAHAGLIAPLTRYTLVVDQPATTFYETPAVGGEIGAGLAVRFP